MADCGAPDLSWQVRLHQGVVEYNTATPPPRLTAYLELTGLDGGDFSLGRAEGHAPIAVDGGDLSSPGWSWSASPLTADGGVFP